MQQKLLYRRQSSGTIHQSQGIINAHRNSLQAPLATLSLGLSPQRVLRSDAVQAKAAAMLTRSDEQAIRRKMIKLQSTSVGHRESMDFLQVPQAHPLTMTGNTHIPFHTKMASLKKKQPSISNAKFPTDFFASAPNSAKKNYEIRQNDQHLHNLYRSPEHLPPASHVKSNMVDASHFCTMPKQKGANRVNAFSSYQTSAEKFAQPTSPAKCSDDFSRMESGANHSGSYQEQLEADYQNYQNWQTEQSPELNCLERPQKNDDFSVGALSFQMIQARQFTPSPSELHHPQPKIVGGLPALNQQRQAGTSKGDYRCVRAKIHAKAIGRNNEQRVAVSQLPTFTMGSNDENCAFIEPIEGASRNTSRNSHNNDTYKTVASSTYQALTVQKKQANKPSAVIMSKPPKPARSNREAPAKLEFFKQSDQSRLLQNFSSAEDIVNSAFKLPKIDTGKQGGDLNSDKIKYQPSKKFNSFQDKPQSFLGKLKQRKVTALKDYSVQKRMTQETPEIDSTVGQDHLENYFNTQVTTPVSSNQSAVTPKTRAGGFATKSRHQKSFSVAEMLQSKQGVEVNSSQWAAAAINSQTLTFYKEQSGQKSHKDSPIEEDLAVFEQTESAQQEIETPCFNKPALRVFTNGSKVSCFTRQPSNRIELASKKTACFVQETSNFDKLGDDEEIEESLETDTTSFSQMLRKGGQNHRSVGNISSTSQSLSTGQPPQNVIDTFFEASADMQ